MSTAQNLTTDELIQALKERGVRVVNARAEVCAFAEAMEAQLRRNDHKGGWQNDSPLDLHARILEESKELRVEVVAHVQRDHSKAVLREAADVANFAMMVADVCGGLNVSP